MVAATRSITISPESETGKLLQDAGETPTVFVVNGSRYRVLREPEPASKVDLWEGYDPQRAIDGMRAAAGSWAHIDAEALIADIYRWREEGSRERFEGRDDRNEKRFDE